MAIYLSCPPLIQTSLFLKARSYTPSCPYNIDIGFIELEFMTDPNYLFVGPPLSKSNTSILGPEAVMSLIKDGANLSA
jgi:hypothetical protein